MVKLPEGAPKLEEILIDTGKMPWREKSLKGISEKMLWRNEETGASIALIRFARGAGPAAALPFVEPVHDLPERQIRIHLDRRGADRGLFYCNPKGNVHGPAIAHEDTVVIEVYDGPHYPEKPSWYTDEQDAR